MFVVALHHLHTNLETLKEFTSDFFEIDLAYEAGINLVLIYSRT